MRAPAFLALLLSPPALAAEGLWDDRAGVAGHALHLTPEDGSVQDLLVTWRATPARRGDLSVVGLFDYSHRPLAMPGRFPGRDDPDVHLGGLATMNLGVAYGLADGVGLSLSAPLYLAALDSSAGAGANLGNARVAATFHLLGRGEDGFSLAAVPMVVLPSPAVDQDLGFGVPAAGGLVAAGVGAGPARLDLNVGAHAGVAPDPFNTRGANRAFASLGGSYAFSSDFALRGELAHARRLPIVLTEGFRTQRESPVDLLLSGRGRLLGAWGWTAGGAIGLLDEAGASEWRAFAGIGWMGSTAAPQPTAALEVAVLEPAPPPEPVRAAEPEPEREPPPEAQPEPFAPIAVAFGFDSAVLPDAVQAELAGVVARIQAQPESTRFRVLGHTDDVGSRDYNLLLSERRAQAVRDHLVAKGVDVDRLDAVGMGPDDPVATNETAEGREQNRRVEVQTASE